MTKSPAVLRGSAAGRRISIPMCDQSTACNPDWHIGTGRAPQSGCIGLHLILYSIHNTATDRRWERLQLSMPPAKKQAPLTTRSSSLRCVSAAEHHTACRTVFLNWQDKTPKASPNEQSIMEYSPELPQDTKSLRSCSGNRAKMLPKGELRIKCHSQYIQIVRLIQHSTVNG